MKSITEVAKIFIGVSLLLAFINLRFTSSPMSGNKTNKFFNPIKNIFPQGWAYFTKDPKSPEFLLYTIDENDNWKKLSKHFPNSTMYNFFGLRRTNRAYTTELALILNNINHQNKWWPIPDSISTIDHLTQNDTILFLAKNPVETKFLPERFAIVKSIPVPWAWRNSDLYPERESIIIDIVNYD